MSAPMRSQIPAHKDPPIVRTLKPPPEIWELVHPVETKQFSPRSNFARRFRLSATSLILMAMVVGLFLGVCTAVVRLRGVQVPPGVAQPAQLGSTANGSETPSHEPPKSAETSALPSPGTVKQQTDVPVADNTRQATAPSIKRKGRNAAGGQQLDIKAESATVAGTNRAPARSTAIDVVGDTSKKITADSTTAKPKSNTSVSPQVIAPVKSDTERKAKVIQWP